ncbi:Mlp family lipoprotein [Borreliella bavariensis]|uniref:Mlp family lipoprotein n=1 Tax=Borreliella bavariensis TaxID=664662 RepID=UPI00165DD6BC|nr:Mlp family lipoprotein [Borreliella bavariensis]
MKIINILFCVFFILLNSCNSDNNDSFNKNNNREVKSIKKRDLSETEKAKSPEELLREKLSEDEKRHLDWLKTALTDEGEFIKFLENDESKIKGALNHIKSELDKCTGKNEDHQKTIFKQVVEGALKEGIDSFADQASSTCGNGN